MVFTGAYTYIQYAQETTFKTNAITCAAAGDKSAFGFEQRIGSISLTNNKIPLSQLGDVRIKTYAYGQTQGSLSVDFVLSNPWWLRLIGFKSPSTTGAGPYTHTYSIDTTTATNVPQSFSVQLGLENGSCDISRVLVGSLARSATISTSVGETARVSLDSAYADEVVTTGAAVLDACRATESITNHIPFTFAHGTLKWSGCSATTIAQVQDVSVTFNGNIEHLFGIGSSVATTTFRRLFEITGSFRASFVDTTELAKVFAQSQNTIDNTSPATTYSVTANESGNTELQLIFDNGLSSTSQRKITITLTGIAIDSHSLNIEPNEPIFEDIPFQASGATVVAINNTATAPAPT